MIVGSVFWWFKIMVQGLGTRGLGVKTFRDAKA
jgi:hypothetical protein